MQNHTSLNTHQKFFPKRIIESGGNHMKFKNSIISLILFAAIIVSVFCLPAAASAQESITYFEDGSYVVSTIRVLPSTRGVNATKTGEKTNDYFGSNGEKLYSITVIASFTYTGSTATATDSDYTYSISKSTWSLVRGSSSCSGASATATATMRCLSATAPASVTLTCSPSGKLS